MHLDKDVDMNMVGISECLASEDFLVELALGLGPVIPEYRLDDPVVLRHGLRSGVVSPASSMEQCEGMASCTVTGNLHEGDYAGDEAIAEMPFEDTIKSRFDPGELPERVVPAAIFPTFVDWEDKSVVDDPIGDILPPDLVKLAKREELSEMYRRSV